MPKISVNLLTWNGTKYVPYLFDSLRKQTFRDWELRILDNGSTDDTVELIKKELETLGVPFHLEQNDANVGFAKGHNQLFKVSQNQYALVLNQDTYLDHDCLARLVAYGDNHAEVGALTPRVMQWHFSYMQAHSKNMDGDLSDMYSSVVDSLGLKVTRARQVVDMEQGALWTKIAGSYPDPALTVFGISGACALYRMSAVQSVAFANGDVFDAVYESYKEDVDLAYRLRLHGVGAATIIDAIVWHDRGVAAVVDTSYKAQITNKLAQPFPLRKMSYRNHLLTLYKNECWQNVLLDLPFIIWYEAKKLVYCLLYDRGVLSSFVDIWRMHQDLRGKRRHIQQTKKISWQEFRTWL